MNTEIWIIQGLIVAIFGIEGAIKLIRSRDKLAKQLLGANDFSVLAIKGIGIAEMPGAIGLLVTLYSGIVPFQTPIAAFGMIAIIVLAATYLLKKGKTKSLISKGIVAIGNNPNTRFSQYFLNQ